ncbi:hypothetical protein LOTGIDRAFT_160587 [Lottia gigantea]|uniref:CYTH domain-containing protein n=1 Tax=Lottia gigantea TaxID=225164 RepID=V4C1V0_LOTGI|nr:hypothetical protein LOTGIDRAFT_160587 [Lottia gigantea]ESO95439.1 hypothetical protein LOTGIDRAFT_160587 [Lottia gigantea]
MPSNIEIKAKIDDLQPFKQKAGVLSGSEATVLAQEDTFFNTPNGRLKLRQIGNEKNSELIFYNRPDQKGPKFSEYHITLVNDPENLKVTLGKAYGIKGVVKKTRYLYIVGQTRIHIDDVDKLGSFMELEVVMKPDQDIMEGEKIAEDLMQKLDITEKSLITGAYMDLLLK